MPDSLETSMLMASVSLVRRIACRAGRRQRRCGPIPDSLAGSRILAYASTISDDQPVPDDVAAGEFGEVDVVDPVEDLARRAKARTGPARQVDLRDVAGDDDLRTEAQAGQEHLHLLGRWCSAPRRE